MLINNYNKYYIFFYKKKKKNPISYLFKRKEIKEEKTK